MTLCDESSSQQTLRCKDCSTCTDGLEGSENVELELKVQSLLRENEDLRKQLQNRRLEAEIFDEEVKNQLEEKNRSEESTEQPANMDNCSDTGKLDLGFVLKKHLAYACTLIEELQMARDEGAMKTDSTTSDQTVSFEIAIFSTNFPVLRVRSCTCLFFLHNQ